MKPTRSRRPTCPGLEFATCSRLVGTSDETAPIRLTICTRQPDIDDRGVESHHSTGRVCHRDPADERAVR